MKKSIISKMYRFSIFLALLVFVSCAFTKPQKPMPKKMNIVFLLADDLRWNSLGCMGNDIVITPNIDAIATQGIKFKNAQVTTPICCVSRATLLTGQYMSRHGIQGFGKAIVPDKFVDTYPAQLRNAGYWTGFVGKYGVGNLRSSDFDFSSIYEGRHWYPVNPELNPNLKANGKTPIIGDSIHVTDRNANDAIKFLKNRPLNKPFNLSVSFFSPHAQDENPRQYLYRPSSEKYYQNVQIPLPSTSNKAALNALPPFISNEKNEGRNRWHWRFDTPEKYQTYMKAYYRLITDVDVAVGKIIAELKAEGEYENTLIVFMGDNGYFQSDHQLADKWYPYEESIRVPLIIYDPRMPSSARGKSNNEFALNIDIAPTMLAAAGVKIPQSIQGLDLSPLYLSKQKLNWRQDFYVEHPVIGRTDFIPASEAVVTHNKKYINWPFYGYEEYFDLKKDPKEVNNGFKDKQNQKDIEILKSRMIELKNQAK